MSVTAQKRPDSFARFVDVLSRHTLIYGAGWIATFALSLINVIVVTSYLNVAEFGRLALLLVISAMLTVIFNLGVLQGVFIWAYGAGDEEAPVDGHEGKIAARGARKTAMGTGLIVTAVLALVGGLLVAIFASPIDRLTGGSLGTTAIAWSGASGGAGALWRVVTNILRFERRPVLFVVTNNLRPLLVTLLSIYALTEGHGVEGAIAATAVGTVISTVFVLSLVRHTYVLAFSRDHLRQITKLGAVYVPVVVAIWVVQHVDQYLVAGFTSEGDLGAYRLASRLSSFVSYGVSAFLMAWAPLFQTSIAEAVNREVGGARVGATFVRWYVFLGLWVVVALEAGAALAVQIAPSSYGQAGGLLSLLAVGFMLYGLLLVINRASQTVHKGRNYQLSALYSMLAFLAVSAITVPTYGAIGAAVAPAAGFLVGVLFLLVRSQRGPNPLPLSYARLLGLCALALVLSLGARWLGEVNQLLPMVAIVVFPLLATVSGLMPVGGLSASVRPLLPTGRRRTRTQAPEHSDVDSAVLDLVVRHRLPIPKIAAAAGIPEAEVERRYSAAIIAAAGVRVTPSATLGAYLLSAESASLRWSDAQALMASGIEPRVLHDLEEAAGAARSKRATRVTWRR